MLTTYLRLTSGSIEPFSPASTDALESALWIDLVNPSSEEIRAVESALRIELPSRQEAEEIEVSSRLYVENSTVFMVATVMVDANSLDPVTTPVTFAYQPERLVTIRFADSTSFSTFPRKLKRYPVSYPTVQKVLLGLINEIIEHAADVLEAVGADLTKVSGLVFAEPNPKLRRQVAIDFTAFLSRVGQNGLRAASSRESLVSLSRLPPFFSEAIQTLDGESLDGYWRVVGQDISSLTDHANFLSNKVNFFLDAALGRINIEQNTVIKIFSIMAVIFLPPTLIASIYGMNFEHMPELRWLFGYPLSLVLMVGAMLFPYLVFKRKGWL